MSRLQICQRRRCVVVLGAGKSAFAGGGVPSSGRKQGCKNPGPGTRVSPSKVSPYGEAYQERADIIAAEILPSCVSHQGCFQNGGRVT